MLVVHLRTMPLVAFTQQGLKKHYDFTKNYFHSASNHHDISILQKQNRLPIHKAIAKMQSL